MVSLSQTTKKYHGRMAEGYEAKRVQQQRWHEENAIVSRMLPDKTRSVVDCPVGTGRFLRLYKDKGVGKVLGVDASTTMLGLAAAEQKRLRTRYDLQEGTATGIQAKSGEYDVAVCVRFLDLIDEDAMRAVVTELCRVARRQIILTIRFGDKYVPKSNTAEHDQKKFWALVSRLGWQRAEAAPIFDQGWHVVSLVPKK